MRRTMIFTRRCAREVLRDPLNLFFGLAFSLAMLLLFFTVNSNMPEDVKDTMFAPEVITPGLAVFGTVFMSLFAGVLIAKDRTTSFLMRLFTSPMRSLDFVLGYTLPMIVFAAVQMLITYSAALLLGLPFTVNIFFAILVTLPVALLFVGLGLLSGSIMNDKAVGGVCGALLTNLAGWLSGVWFPLETVGGGFEAVAHALPFYHAAQAAQLAYGGDFGAVLPHFLVVAAYTVVIYLLAVVVFYRRMRGDKV